MLKEHIEPRLYQQTIFNTAAQKNTLAVLPTGMGKTLIAEMLIIHRLQHYKGSKVLFLAPTRPLVQQHLTTFEAHVDIDAEAVCFTGNVPPAKRAKQWKESSIIFSTPQGIENDILSGRINLKEVSLIIFDEAHRTTGDYAYVFIADKYRKQAEHERILALTASPGDDKETIEQICVHLGIEEIEVRSQDSPDVQPYIQAIDIEHVHVQMPAEFKQLHDALTRCMRQRYDDLQTLGVVNKQALANKTTMLKTQAALHAQAARGQKNFESLKSMSLLAEALKMQHAIELIETQGLSSLRKYFDKLQGEAAKGKSKAVQNIVADVQFKHALLLAEKFTEANVEHPKLRALQKVVLKELYQQRDSKIIIFNQYRDQATEIKKSMDKIGVSARIFVGQMKKGDTGMSQKVQQQTLEEFRNGEFSCLIATSVAEEGLDIPKVDTVIFYEPIPSAIRSVQRRGRTGRQEKGRIVMLVTEGTRDVAYKFAAKNKEKRMYRVLDEVKRTFRQKPTEKRTLQDFSGPVVIADHREKASGVLKYLSDMPVQLRLEQLQVADYLLSDRVAVEYKTVADFVDSIVDGRLLQQLRPLRKYPRAMIVIEGEADLFSMRNVHPNAILGMLGTIAVSYNIPVLFTRTPQETASLFHLIAKRESERGSGEPVTHQKPSSINELQEFVVSSLPGLGPATAKRVLSHFKSVRNVANASAEELANVEKLGQKRAKELYNFFSRDYDPTG